MKPVSIFIHAMLFASFIITTSGCGIVDLEYRLTTAEDISESKFANTTVESNENFLIEAAEISLEEILFAQLAQEKGLSPYIKKLGKKSESTHHKLFRELHQIATGKFVIIPDINNDEVLLECKKMRLKYGNDFDKQFCAHMVKCHKKAINLFESVVVSTTDPGIRNFALKALPSLHELLENSNSCHTICKKNKRCYPSESSVKH